MKNRLIANYSCIIIVLSFIFIRESFSQSISNYNFSASSGTWSYIYNATSPSPTSASCNGDEAVAGTFNIGFDFWYMGTRYTAFGVSTNGFLSLGTTPNGTGDHVNTLDGSSYSSSRPILAPLWDDMWVSSTSSGGVYYRLTGTSPNRVLTVEWYRVYWNYNAGSVGVDFQVKLYETSNKIDFVYNQQAGGLNTPSASIGITTTATGSGNFLSLNGTGTGPAASSTSETTTLNSKPANGQTYTFDPSSNQPNAPSGLNVNVISCSQIDLSWTDNASNELGYEIYYSTNSSVPIDGSSSTLISKSANSTSHSVTGLSAGTMYYFKVFARKEGLSTPASNNGTTSSPSVGGSVSGATTPICVGSGTGTMTLSGHTGSVLKWQKRVNAGAWSDITNTSTTFSESPSSSGTWDYRAEVQNGGCASAFSNVQTVVVNSTSVGGTASSSASLICQGNTVNLTLSGHTGSIQWQSSADGSSWSDISGATSTPYTTAAINSPTYYRAKVTSGACAAAYSNAVFVSVQTCAVIGSGTSTQRQPFDRYYNYSTCEMIYLQSEITYSGSIEKIAFDKNNGNNVASIDNVTIYMKHTSSSTIASGTYDLTGYTQVYNGSYTNNATSGWMEVTLSTPFNYNNTDNLQVLIIKGYQAYIGSSTSDAVLPFYKYTSTSASYRTRFNQDDASQPASLTQNYNRPNIRLIINTSPQAPVFYNTAANTSLQTSFNHIRNNSTAPMFTLSSSYTSTLNRFQIELNTSSDFTGTARTQTFSGTYNPGQKYDLTCNSLSSALPASNAVYFVRARASADGGATWGNWSSNLWVYTYGSSDFGWHFTAKNQFDLGTLLYNNYGNFITTNNNGTPSDNTDDYVEIGEGNSDNSITAAGDQALTEGSTFYSGASNNCITVGYYNVTGNQDYHGFRFSGAQIPQGATILTASITPYAHSGSGCGGSSNTTNQLIMRIRGVNQDNCNSWANNTNTSTGDPKNRVRTTAGVDWNVPSGASQQWSTGLLVTTAPDITNVIQEIVSRPGYAAGNALGLIVDHNSGTGNYWRYFATMSASSSYSARLQTTFTNFSNDIQFPNVDLASYAGATSWNELVFDVDKASCGACDVTFYVYNTSGPTLIASGNTSPISLGNNTASTIYVVARIKRNSSPKLKSMTIKATGGVLPIDMLSFNAECDKNNINILWETASELNNDGFILERSCDGSNYEIITKIKGAGNSNSIKKYSYKDENYFSEPCYYQIKQVDYNGEYKYYGPIVVKCDNNNVFELVNVIPNPTTDNLYVSYNNSKEELIEITVFDVVGKTMYLEKQLSQNGENIISLNLDKLAKGVYFLKINNGQKYFVEKVVKD